MATCFRPCCTPGSSIADEVLPVAGGTGARRGLHRLSRSSPRGGRARYGGSRFSGGGIRPAAGAPAPPPHTPETRQGTHRGRGSSSARLFPDPHPVASPGHGAGASVFTGDLLHPDRAQHPGNVRAGKVRHGKVRGWRWWTQPGGPGPSGVEDKTVSAQGGRAWCPRPRGAGDRPGPRPRGVRAGGQLRFRAPPARVSQGVEHVGAGGVETGDGASQE